MQHGISVIPKSTKPDRIEENAGIWGWELSTEDFATLSNLKTQVDGSFYTINTEDSPVTFPPDGGIERTIFLAVICGAGPVIHIGRQFARNNWL